MDSITRLAQKYVQERAQNEAQQQQQSTLPETAPPPYSESDMSSDDEDDEDDDQDSASVPVKLVINAANRIQGSNNLVPTSPTPLADATKFSTLLLHAINQINSANALADAHAAAASRRPRLRRPLKVDLTINCGLTVVGERNVIGNVALRPKAPGLADASATPSPTVAGAKRKAGDACDAEDREAVKRPTVVPGHEQC